MRPTRGTILAAALVVTLAAPAATYAVASADDSRPAAHKAKHDDHGKPQHPTGTEHAADASTPGRAHAAAMRAWAHCVAEAASGPKSGDHSGPPKDACGDKPVAPGRAKHAGAEAPGRSGDHRPASPGQGHGRGQGGD